MTKAININAYHRARKDLIRSLRTTVEWTRRNYTNNPYVDDMLMDTMECIGRNLYRNTSGVPAAVLRSEFRLAKINLRELQDEIRILHSNTKKAA